MRKFTRILSAMLALLCLSGTALSDTFTDVDAPFEFESAQSVETVQAAAAAPLDAQSAPYSSIGDFSYWTMAPGETDDAKIWEAMTQPITVYDGGLGGTDHAYVMENPDGTGKKVAQIHGQSQGLHVIGETNEHGYVQVEVFSNYDRSYMPADEEEFAHAYELRTGYVKAKNLKTVTPQQDIGLLLDKLTQRLYIFCDGERVAELKISTGKVEGVDEALFETITGEFITISHTGTFKDNSKYPMICNDAIRINGGILLHEVPHKERADGSSDYSAYEPLLGQKASHGCVRIQWQKTDNGYNHRWLWNNLKRGAPYRVLIWDDKNRIDSPTVWVE